jgi:hypothetical protein
MTDSSVPFCRAVRIDEPELEIAQQSAQRGCVLAAERRLGLAAVQADPGANGAPLSLRMPYRT